jgi:hypothetical protein
MWSLTCAPRMRDNRRLSHIPSIHSTSNHCGHLQKSWNVRNINRVTHIPHSHRVCAQVGSDMILKEWRIHKGFPTLCSHCILLQWGFFSEQLQICKMAAGFSALITFITFIEALQLTTSQISLLVLCWTLMTWSSQFSPKMENQGSFLNILSIFYLLKSFLYEYPMKHGPQVLNWISQSTEIRLI